MTDPRHPALATDQDWKRVRDLLRSRAVSPEERESLRRVLLDAGQLGSLVRAPAAVEEER